MKKLAVIHFLPLEDYPPILNLLAILDDDPEIITKAYSTQKFKKVESPTLKNVEIQRSKLPTLKSNRIVRSLYYINFIWKTLRGLIAYRPDLILYYDPFSIGPIYLYSKYFNPNSIVLGHYHELFTSEWYKKAMLMVRLFHNWEKSYIYRKVDWISQTNEERVRLFLEQNPLVDKSKLHVVPNYPPLIWKDMVVKVSNNDNILKLVYVGAISLRNTYIKEVCEWVDKSESLMTLDIYSNNYDKETYSYLTNLKKDYIKFYYKGIAYDDLPKILPKYSVGLILYKADDLNFKFNAPNKLFEYYRCGLKVWCSEDMIGLKNIISEEELNLEYLNFNNLPHLKELIFVQDRKNMILNSKYSAETALKELINAVKV
ncbi:glycosyltransferase family 4 protein [Robertkochia solimangrovi]|uniref:glycosyltransferase family 4 protein n=1 Tax=Robertkochia solimangrovi TaxID=2213046 RepID=UPI0011800A04|nr:glycosyltransferase family 4 protein [Robertkochia solimangrovi]TRZ44995.1 hypothetical protein DMZ48_04330 [Robertkochia solimangrovi]